MRTDTTKAARNARAADAPSRRMSVRAIAEAAALGDVAAVLCLIASVFPLAAAAGFAASLPVAIVGLRHRARVVVLAVIVGAMLGFVLGGTGTATATIGAGLIGGPVGIGARRGWSPLHTGARAALFVGLPFGLFATGLLAALPGLRKVAFESTLISYDGIARLVNRVGAGGVTPHGREALSNALEYWPISVPAFLTAGLTVGALVMRLILIRPLRAAQHQIPAPVSVLPEPGRSIGIRTHPNVVPLRGRGLTLRYAGSDRVSLALAEIDLTPGEFVAVTGPNGAGKSTLARVLAGTTPTTGMITVPANTAPGGQGAWAPELGRPHGTALVFQRPESQVLGVRVADDIRWGLPPDHEVDVEALLERVGLGGMGERDTATLSGGQLQRLALASALARRPALLISDESTAMLDQPGRDAVLGLFHEAAAADGTTVVHITHHDDEATAADRAIALAAPEVPRPPSDRVVADGVVTDGVVTDGVVPAPGRPVPTSTAAGSGRSGVVEVRALTQIRDHGSPWENPVLADVNLRIPAGGAVALMGANGSGKSTLAWILAGLTKPTRGTATMDGEPIRNGPGAALLGMQFSRLQLLRGTVGADIADAGRLSGPGEPGKPDAAALAAVDELLARVGLDPQTYRDRDVDELSGGEQRRVVLAGLLAAAPRLLVLDEPLAGLDGAARVAMRAALTQVRAAGTTLIIVTHDLEQVSEVVDDVYEIVDGALVPVARRYPDAMRAPQPDAAALPPLKRRRPAMGAVLGRTLPGTSAAHEWWVGTKLAVLVVMALAVGIFTTWPVLAAATVIVGLWFVAAGSPWRAVPKLPRFFLLVTGFSLALAAIGNAEPRVDLGGISIGLGGVDVFARGFAAAMIALAAAFVFCWTTPLGQLPGFFQGCADLAARFRISATALTTAAALAIRVGPLILVEVQTMWQLANQRRAWQERGGRMLREPITLTSLFDLLLVACTQSCRRAAELAEAMAARGGLGTVAARPAAPRVRDVGVIGAAIAIAAVGIAVDLLLG